MRLFFSLQQVIYCVLIQVAASNILSLGLPFSKKNSWVIRYVLIFFSMFWFTNEKLNLCGKFQEQDNYCLICKKMIVLSPTKTYYFIMIQILKGKKKKKKKINFHVKQCLQNRTTLCQHYPFHIITLSYIFFFFYLASLMDV